MNIPVNVFITNVILNKDYGMVITPLEIQDPTREISQL